MFPTTITDFSGFGFTGTAATGRIINLEEKTAKGLFFKSYEGSLFQELQQIFPIFNVSTEVSDNKTFLFRNLGIDNPLILQALENCNWNSVCNFSATDTTMTAKLAQIMCEHCVRPGAPSIIGNDIANMWKVLSDGTISMPEELIAGLANLVGQAGAANAAMCLHSGGVVIAAANETTWKSGITAAQKTAHITSSNRFDGWIKAAIADSNVNQTTLIPATGYPTTSSVVDLIRATATEARTATVSGKLKYPALAAAIRKNGVRLAGGPNAVSGIGVPISDDLMARLTAEYRAQGSLAMTNDQVIKPIYVDPLNPISGVLGYVVDDMFKVFCHYESTSLVSDYFTKQLSYIGMCLPYQILLGLSTATIAAIPDENGMMRPTPLRIQQMGFDDLEEAGKIKIRGAYAGGSAVVNGGGLLFASNYSQ